MPKSTTNGLPGIYNAVLPTVEDEAGSALAVDANGQLVLSPNTTINVVSGGSAAASPQVQGVDATGQDAYATVKNPTADATHIFINNKGANGCIISLDGGVTDHFTIQGGAIITLDSIAINNGVAIQAKNETAGQNYSDLTITIW